MYHVYKASFNTYRILNTETNHLLTVTPENLVIHNPHFVVSQSGYRAAKEKGFKNSGNKRDYFAYIQTDLLPVVLADRPEIPRRYKQLKFNPFKSNLFFKVADNEPITEAKTCLITSNDLFFCKKDC